MADPNDTMQPDTYPSGDPDTSTEGGWIPLSDPHYNTHINAGVPNKMFYLLSEGGAHNGVHVEGIGILNAARLMYRANKRKWEESTKFLEARQGSINEAEEWDANHAANWADSVRNAWAAVNVGDPTGDIYEPDGSIDHAKVIEFDVQQLHSIKPIGDHDWMIFTLNETTSVCIETSGPSGDTQMWLRDDQGTEIEYDDNGGYGYFSKIERDLDAGTYYIEIDEEGNNQEIVTYYVNLNVLIKLPDLTIPYVSAWDYYYGYPYCRVGWPTFIRVTTKNDSDTSVGSASKTGIYIDGGYLGYWNIDDLGAHSSSTKYGILYFYTSGWHSIEAKADKSGTITEENEDNNWGGMSFYIYPW